MKNFLFLLLYTSLCYSINPKKDYITVPDKWDLHYSEYLLNFSDGSQICSWVILPNHNNQDEYESKTIILAYGDFGNMSYYMSYADYYSKLGYTVITFDYRGFGKSSAFEIDKNTLFYSEFATDLENIVGYYKNKFNLKDIGIVSLSMGTIATAYVAQSNNFSFIIAEGCVYDCQEIVKRLKNLKDKEVLLSPQLSDFKTVWSKLKTPLLIIVGSHDKITTLEDALIIKSQGSRREIISYEGDHLGFFNEKNDLQKITLSIRNFIDGK